MKRQLPVGMDDYKTIVDGDYFIVDKSLFIKEIAEKGAKVFLLPRPRRFGKTLNMSMLQAFFEHPISRPCNIKAEPLEHLFHDKLVWQHENMRKLQGKSPVIALTFKDIKPKTWQTCYEKIVATIADEYKVHDYLLAGDTLKSAERTDFEKIASKRGSLADYEDSLKNLSTYLQRHYQTNVTVLVDEYDAPIHAGYLNGFYDEVVNFSRSLFSAVFKNNPALERGVITGILRTAKEGIFSGLNNLDVYSLLNKEFSDKFGFTPQEVMNLLEEYGFESHEPQVRKWYDGYTTQLIDSATQLPVNLYNPWSLINYVGRDGELFPYWANTSDHGLIKKMLPRVSSELLENLKEMLTGQPSTQIIDEGMVFPDMEKNTTAIWSLFFFSGYLTSADTILNIEGKHRGKYSCKLKIPNEEVLSIYEKLLQSICVSASNENFDVMLQALVTGDVELFVDLFTSFFVNMMSVYDIPYRSAERSYHLFVLGMLTPLAATHEIRSNRESGGGRYDIMLEPKDKAKLGIIVEFKKVKYEITPSGKRRELSPEKQEEVLYASADEALAQIREKNYAAELRARGVENIVAYGIAVDGKSVVIKTE